MVYLGQSRQLYLHRHILFRNGDEPNVWILFHPERMFWTPPKNSWHLWRLYVIEIRLAYYLQPENIHLWGNSNLSNLWWLIPHLFVSENIIPIFDGLHGSTSSSHAGVTEAMMTKKGKIAVRAKTFCTWAIQKKRPRHHGIVLRYDGSLLTAMIQTQNYNPHISLPLVYDL